VGLKISYLQNQPVNLMKYYVCYFPEINECSCLKDESDCRI